MSTEIRFCTPARLSWSTLWSLSASKLLKIHIRQDATAMKVSLASTRVFSNVLCKFAHRLLFRLGYFGAIKSSFVRYHPDLLAGEVVAARQHVSRRCAEFLLDAWFVSLAVVCRDGQAHAVACCLP